MLLQMKGLFVEADLVGSLIDASGERANFPSAISSTTASASRALGNSF
jgi:hypothetical protein